ncbi:hypothetical protein ACTFIV_003645 [Dictyostelium citrinum]
MNHSPIISVILPFLIKNNDATDNNSLNNEGINNLIISIDSIIEQTFKEWELILIDDGSNNEILKELLLKRYSTDNRIRFLIYKENKGIVKSLNDAILNHCSPTSKYIARMDSDDISHPTRLQSQFKYLQSNETVDILGCPIKMFNNNKLIEILNNNIDNNKNNNNNDSSSSSSNSNINDKCNLNNVKELINIINNEESFKFIQHPDKDILMWSMFFNCCIVHPSVIFKRSIFTLEHCYEENSQFPFIEDYLFWLKSLVMKGLNISNVQSSTPLLYLRKHNNSISYKNLEKQKDSAANASCYYLNILFKRFNIDSEIQNFSSSSPSLSMKDIIQFFQLSPSSLSKINNISIELFELAFKYLEIIEQSCIKQQPNYSNSIKDAANEKMGELVSLCLSKFPNNKKSSLVWEKWLSRNPTSQLLSLLSNLNLKSSNSLINNNNNKNNSNNNKNNNNYNNSILNFISDISNNNFTAPKLNNSNNKFKENGIRVICFSKDRAFQLKEYLRTFFKYLKNNNENFEIMVDVLFTYSNEKFKNSYQIVIESFPQVNFTKEDNFTDQLITLVQKTNKLQYIMFSVDDILYYNEFNLEDYCFSLNNEPLALGFYMKLNQNITYCHTCNEDIIIPTLNSNIVTMKTTTNDSTTAVVDNFKYFKWNRNENDCKRDWNYPWDLCSTIYRSNDVDSIINGIIKYYGIRNGINHPNRFEFNGNRPIIQKQIYQNKPYCLCLAENYSPMSVVTINRVQDVYDNPIYDQSLSLDDLDQLLYTNKSLNDEKYKENSLSLNFKSVHIGDLFIS